MKKMPMTPRRSPPVPLLLIATLLLASCAVGPDYVRPDAASPAAFTSLLTFPRTKPTDYCS